MTAGGFFIDTMGKDCYHHKVHNTILMKIAFIHEEKKIGSGATYINDLIAMKLRARGIAVKNFYPKSALIDTPHHLKGLSNILFFYSLLERRNEILKFDLVQGTTYTPLPFIPFRIPTIAHFGSTTEGFLHATPRANAIENGVKKIWYMLKKEKAIRELNAKTRKPLRDIADIEHYVAARANAIIATSQNVKQELISAAVPEHRIHIIHNAIEDYWYDNKELPDATHLPPCGLVFLGRLGNDVFTLKLKGFDRLIYLYRSFPNIQKTTIAMTTNRKLINWIVHQIPCNRLFTNVRKDLIPKELAPLRGSILFIASRYEGFSLSLIEGMSQGLIPVTYPVGVAPEIIVNKENGFLVHTQKEAIEAIQLLQSDAALRAQMMHNAWKTAQNFRADRMIDQMIALYKKVLPYS